MKNVNLILLTAIAATVMASCSKHPENTLLPDQGTEGAPSTIRSLSIRPDASTMIVADTDVNNPYEYIGIQHDSGCSVLAAEIDSSSPTLDADILNDTKKFLYALSYDTASFDSTYTVMVENDLYSIPDSTNGNNPTTLFSSLYSFGYITEDTYNYLNTMNTIVNAYITSDTPTQTMYNNAASQIVEIETEIRFDASLPSLQKDALLATGAVYRYSGAYWGTIILQKGTTLFGIKLHWKKFFAHDASGAISGFIIGGIVGLHSAIIGGLGGGVGASVGYLFTGE